MGKKPVQFELIAKDTKFSRGVSAKSFKDDIRSQIAYQALIEMSNRAQPIIQRIFADVMTTIPHGMHGSHGPGHNGIINLTENIMHTVITKNNKSEMRLRLDIDLYHKRAERRSVGNSKYGQPVDMLYAFNNGWNYPYKLYIPESFYDGKPDPYGSHTGLKFTRNYYPGDGFINEAAYRIELALMHTGAEVGYDRKYKYTRS